jgi:hypothetical protein
MDEPFTLTLPRETREAIESAARRDGVSPGQLIEKAIREHLLISEFRNLRSEHAPQARKLGIETDQDVFDMVS